mgnify:CR=1 FL=1
MKTRFILSAICTLMIIPAFAQTKVVKEVERAVKKDGADIVEARKLIQTTLVNPETENSAYAWYVAGLVEEKVVEQGFINQQLGKEVKESEFYTPLYDMITYYEKAAELDNLPNEKGKIKPKFTKKISEAIGSYYNQLINAGNEGLTTGDFTKAHKYFSKFGEVKKMGIFNGTPIATSDSLSMEVAFFSAYAATQMKDNYQNAIPELEAIKNVPFNQNEVYQLLALSQLNVGDTVAYVNTLKEAIDIFPTEPMYLTNLANMHIIKGENEEALHFLNKLLETEPNNPIVHAAIGQIYTEGLKDYEKGELAYLKAIEIDPESQTAIYGLAQVYFNQGADAINNANSINDNAEYQKGLAKAKEFYKKALPYLEKVHQLDPDNSQFRTALYNVYYNLDMEDKMAAMDAEQK